MIKSDVVKLINKYFTPFALFLILSAAFVSPADRTTVLIAIALFLISIFFNLFTVRLIDAKHRNIKFIGNVRVISNFVIDIVIVWLLIGMWGPLWLLFVLTPVAGAIYYDRKKSFFIAIISASTLLTIYFFRGLEGWVGWGQAVTHAGFIVLITMFVSSLCRICFMPSK